VPYRHAILAWAAGQRGGGTLRWQVGYPLIATLRYTGVRLAEITSLRLDHLDLQARQLSVLGKGAKRRLVPVPAALAVRVRQPHSFPAASATAATTRVPCMTS
jgi:integrase